VLGRLVIPGRQDMSIWLTIAIGIVAVLIGAEVAEDLLANRQAADQRE
jgi:hypothetical protein